MSLWSKLIGNGMKEPVQAIGEVFDNLFTSDEETLTLEIAKQRLAMQPALAQAKINEIQAQSRSTFVAGGRPFLMWICGCGYAFAFLINPIIQWLTGDPGPQLPMESMDALTTGMLGLASLRTVEKVKGVSK